MSTYTSATTSVTITSGSWNSRSYITNGVLNANGNWIYFLSTHSNNPDLAIQFSPSTDTWSDHTLTSYPHTITRDSTGVVEGYGPPGNSLTFRFNCPYFGNTYVTGPTVTSITVANEIASTRQFTVTHTGTLTASDICYTIDGVDITSLTSPNTPITNLQTTSTGSTFDSYTVSKFGTHSINIGEKYLNFLVANSTTNQDIFSSNYNITVNFPALSSGTYTDNLGTLVSGAAVDSVLYGSQRIKIKIEKGLILMYVWIYENYNSYQVGIQSFKVLIQQWDYGDLTGNTPAYISNAYYVKPDTLYESTGSPNTLLTFPAGMLVDTYNWNFATDNNVPVSTTTSDGGGKRRYPIISTNLFDRQKSIFSIGKTHKDETLF